MNLLAANLQGPGRIASVGMYDGVHRGHAALMEFLQAQAAARGLKPTVVTFRTHPLLEVAPERAPRMLTPLNRRLELLEQTGVHDCILLNFAAVRTLPAARFMSMLREEYGVRALVVGFNHRMGHDCLSGIDALTEAGRSAGIDIIPAPEFRLPPDDMKVSSSRVRTMLQNADIDSATRALGRPYSLSGIVVGGNRIGRTLGFPTANLQPSDPQALIPSDGVYVADAITPDGERRRAVVNIGKRPTITGIPTADTPSVIEVHILNYTGNLYDSPLTIEFLRHLRPERRFPNPDALRAQLRSDISAATL